MSVTPSAHRTPGLRVAITLWAGWPAALLVAAAALAAALVARLVIASGPPPLSYDAYAAVVHFERLASASHLEVELGTTPKPLLTLALGLVHAVGGWTLVGAVSIAAWAGSAGLGAALASRTGGVVAGCVAGILLAISPTLLLEAAWGLGTVWAIGLWCAAGLAASAARPRWRVAGALLGLASLSRPETLLIIATWLGLVIALRASGRREPDGAAGGGVLALWCLPVMLAHDWLLTGDPLFWTRVSADYGSALAAAGARPSPADGIRLVGTVLVEAPLRTALAGFGVLALARRRAWPILFGLAALSAGMAVALPMLAGSGRLADPRYLEPIRFGLLLSASIAIGWLPASLHASRVAARLRLDRPRWRLLATVATVLLALGVAAWPTPAPLDPAVQSTIARFELLSSAAEIAAPPLRRIVAADPAIAGWPASARLSDRDRLDVFAVPGNIRPRLALDLGVPLTRIVATDPASLDLMAGRPPAGEIVVHCDADLPVPVFRPLEVSEPSNLGPVVLIPVLADAARGVWIVRLDAAGGGSPLSTPARR